MKSLDIPLRDTFDLSCNLTDPQGRTDHHPLIIALHWFTLVALLMGVAAVLLREVTEGRAIRLELLNLHRSMGILVLLITTARLVLRQTVGHPAPVIDSHWLVHRMAALSHILFYILLTALPMLGWALTSARGMHANVFGVIPLPSLVASDADLADRLADFHAWGSWALLALVIIHASAALWHHHIRRDQVLTSMLPKRRKTAYLQRAPLND